MSRRRVLVETVSGEDIFATAEIMTPAEFVARYAGKMPPESGSEVSIPESLTEWLFKEQKEKSVKRFPKPPRTTLAGDGGIIGAELSPETLGGALATRAGKGRLPQTMPYIHPGTASDTLVPAGNLVGRKAGETGGGDDGIVVVDEANQPIDLSALAKILTDYNKPGFTLLKQNEKMAKSTGEQEAFYNVGIPAIMGLVFDERAGKFKIINTCPSAGACMHVCYATKGGYVQYRAVSEKQNLALNLLYNRPSEYIDRMVDEIVKAVKHSAKKYGVKTVIRWHDSGDFFSNDYVRLAYHIIERVKEELPPFLRNFVSFYAYTKRIKATKELEGGLSQDTTSGLLLRKSVGAKPEDEREINPTNDMFSVIVPKEVKSEMVKIGAIKRIGEGEEGEGKWVYAPGREEEVKKAILASPDVKFKNDYPMLTMLEYEKQEDKLEDNEKVNVIILPGENDRPAKDPHVAGVYLMFH